MFNLSFKGKFILKQCFAYKEQYIFNYFYTVIRLSRLINSNKIINIIIITYKLYNSHKHDYSYYKITKNKRLSII